ncbi:hypothetical protein [Actinomadura sp. 9N407]|uniref:hypothetical protein n=1 Tax=Actinomadura sp. 9N407 TaxID=3375154 RepID=UPI0037AB05E9
MQITPVTVPGIGTLHHARTRRGDSIGVLAHHRGTRTLLVYDSDPRPVQHHRADPDSPARSIELDHEEADQLSQLLHDQPIADRLAAVERRLGELAAPDDTDRR